jgi:hypothetical protein
MDHNTLIALCITGWLLLPTIFYLIGAMVQRAVGVDREAPEAPFCWRGINLALGDGVDHPEACQELRGLRAAGWHIEKQGSERGGFVYLKCIAPGHKE